MSIGTVSAWNAVDGWGVIESPDTPGGCFGHYSNIDADGFKALEVGQAVEFDWERLQSGFEQDGYAYRATRIRST